MSNIEHVSMLLDLFIQILNAGELCQCDLCGGLFLGQCLSQVVVSGVEGVCGKEVGDGDG